MTKNVYRSSYKVTFILVNLMKLEFSQHIFEKIYIKISNFMKIRPVGADLFHADRRTDMTKLKVAFSNFVNAPKEGRLSFP